VYACHDDTHVKVRPRLRTSIWLAVYSIISGSTEATTFKIKAAEYLTRLQSLRFCELTRTSLGASRFFTARTAREFMQPMIEYCKTHDLLYPSITFGSTKSIRRAHAGGDRNEIASLSSESILRRPNGTVALSARPAQAGPQRNKGWILPRINLHGRRIS
jgi:hypothetical protein